MASWVVKLHMRTRVIRTRVMRGKATGRWGGGRGHIFLMTTAAIMMAAGIMEKMKALVITLNAPDTTDTPKM